MLLAALGSPHAGPFYVVPGSTRELRRAAGCPLLGAGAVHFDPARRAVQTTDGTSNATNAAVAAILTQPARCVHAIRPRCRPVAVGETESQRRARRVACAGQVRHVEAEVLDLVEPADVHLVGVLVRLEPRGRPLVCP